MINFSIAPTNENLTKFVLKSDNFGDYFQSCYFLEWLFKVSPEPFIFKYNKNKTIK